jgi:hypothetical protein
MLLEKTVELTDDHIMVRTPSIMIGIDRKDSRMGRNAPDPRFVSGPPGGSVEAHQGISPAVQKEARNVIRKAYAGQRSHLGDLFHRLWDIDSTELQLFEGIPRYVQLREQSLQEVLHRVSENIAVPINDAGTDTLNELGGAYGPTMAIAEIAQEKIVEPDNMVQIEQTRHAAQRPDPEAVRPVSEAAQQRDGTITGREDMERQISLCRMFASPEKHCFRIFQGLFDAKGPAGSSVALVLE